MTSYEAKLRESLSERTAQLKVANKRIVELEALMADAAQAGGRGIARQKRKARRLAYFICRLILSDPLHVLRAATDVLRADRYNQRRQYEHRQRLRQKPTKPWGVPTLGNVLRNLLGAEGAAVEEQLRKRGQGSFLLETLPVGQTKTATPDTAAAKLPRATNPRNVLTNPVDVS